MEELRKCPFCGGKAYFDRKGDGRKSTIMLCDDCGCRLESGETFNHGAQWNTRASDAAIKELLDGLTKLRSVFSGAPFNDFNISICHNIDKLISTATGIK